MNNNIDNQTDVNTNKKNLSNRKSKFFKYLKRILILFVIFNVTLIASVWIVDINGKPFPQSRMCMKLAEEVNDYYIFPLSVFGLDNPLTWPFYSIRDGLYNLGLKFYPKGEGEEQIWWTNIYFNEYKMIVDDRFTDYTLFPGKHRHFTTRERELFHEVWPKTLYEQLEPLLFAKISNKEMAKDKYLRFLLLAHNAMMINDGIIALKHSENGDHGPVTLTSKERILFENVYKMNEKYKQYAKSQEPDVLNYVMSDPNKKSKDLIVKFYSAKRIITSKYRLKELSCNDPYITVFVKSHKELLDYMNKYPQDNRYIASLIGYSPDQVDMSRTCQTNPILNDYIKYVENGMGMSINSPMLTSKGDK